MACLARPNLSGKHQTTVKGIAVSHHHLLFEFYFNTSPQALFEQLTDHQRFGQLLGQSIQRVVDAPASDAGVNGTGVNGTGVNGTGVNGTGVNGIGSVRRITLLPGLFFEETVRQYQYPTLMAYQITRGSPVKDHWGRLAFHPQGEGCLLNYTIDFETKIPGTGWLLKLATDLPIRAALTRLQKQLEQDSANPPC